MRCPKCNSDKLIPHVKIIDTVDPGATYPLQVEVYEKPNGLPFFQGAHQGTLEATICGECGHTELTVTNPDELYQAYLKANRRS